MPRQTVASGEGQLAGTQPIPEQPDEPMITEAKADGTINIGVEFSAISFSANKARMGFKLKANVLHRDLVHQFFVDRSLHVTVQPKGQQQSFDDMGPVEFNSVAEVRGFGTRSDGYSISLYFDISDIDAGDLVTWAKQEGRLICKPVKEQDDTKEAA